VTTFRERLFGAGQARLPADHPGARFRAGALVPGEAVG
jgi:hypothetical protein